MAKTVAHLQVLPVSFLRVALFYLTAVITQCTHWRYACHSRKIPEWDWIKVGATVRSEFAAFKVASSSSHIKRRGKGDGETGEPNGGRGGETHSVRHSGVRHYRPQVGEGHLPRPPRHPPRRRQPLPPKGPRLRRRRLINSRRHPAEGLRQLRGSGGRPRRGCGLRAAAHGDAPALGAGGGGEEEARAAGEARGPVRPGSRSNPGGLRSQRRAVHGRHHVAAPPSDGRHAPVPLRSHTLRRPRGEIAVVSSLISEHEQIHSTSTFCADAVFLEHNIRVKPDLDSLGALGDLGWYSIGAILWAADYDLPSTATALPSPQFNEAGVLLSCGAAFHWPGGVAATFQCSFLSAVSMDLSAQGSGGSLQLTDLAIPFREDKASFETTAGSHFSELHLGWTRTPEETVVETPLPQEAMMLEEFAWLAMGVRDGARRPEVKWGEITRKTQLLVEAVKTSIELGCKTVEL